MYKFVDTTEASQKAALPSEALKLNGEYIENLISGYRTLNVTGRELVETEIDEVQIGFCDGSIYQKKRDVSRQITVYYRMKAESPEEFRDKYNQLCGILDKEQSQLIFADEPDKYFIGTKSDVEEVQPGLLCVTGNFTFECADLYKYAVTEKTAINRGTNVITLENDGTKTVPVNVRAVMKSDNGYLGLTLEDRFYQVGNPEEIDGEQFETTELLFDDHFTKDRGWNLNQGITPPVTSVRDQVGAVRYVVETPGEGINGEGYVTPSEYGTGNSWHGPALTKLVPADKNGEYPVNWYSCYRFDFNTDGTAQSEKGKEAGHHSITFSDENDDIICSVVFEDNHYSLERSDMAVYIGNKRIWDTRNTTKFYVRGPEGRPEGSAVVIVEKIGNQINVKFSYAGINKTFITSNPNAKLKKITYYSAQYKNYPHIRNNLLRAIQVRKHNVDNFNDIPNYFMNGDDIRIEGRNNQVLINGLVDWDRVDIGSKPLLLPPGQHTLGIITSSFGQTPDVKVTWRERWI